MAQNSEEVKRSLAFFNDIFRAGFTENGEEVEFTNLYKRLDFMAEQDRNQFAYVVDFVTEKHVYVSGNVKNLLGYDADVFIADGIKIVATLFHPDDMELLRRYWHCRERKRLFGLN